MAAALDGRSNPWGTWPRTSGRCSHQLGGRALDCQGELVQSSWNPGSSIDCQQGVGFACEASLAAAFGATHVTDAYLVGQTIPVILLASVGAALGTTLIPVLARARAEQGRQAAFRMTNSAINAALLLSLGSSSWERHLPIHSPDRCCLDFMILFMLLPWK